MKSFLLLLALANLCAISHSQSKLILKVFRALPSEKLYDLSLALRDSLLAGKTYYPSDNDSNSIMAFNYGISPDVNDYLYVSRALRLVNAVLVQ